MSRLSAAVVLLALSILLPPTAEAQFDGFGLDPTNLDGDRRSNEAKWAMKGGKEAPEVDYDPEDKVRAYLEQRLPAVADEFKVLQVINLEGCYAVPQEKKYESPTDPRVQRGVEREIVRRDIPKVDGKRVTVKVKEPPEREWKSLKREGLAVLVSYPSEGQAVHVAGRFGPNIGDAFTPPAELIVMLDLKGKVVGAVRPMDFHARKPGTEDELPDDGTLDPFKDQP